MRRIELTPRELSDKAFTIYSLSSFILYENKGGYYLDGAYIGDSLEDVNDYLETMDINEILNDSSDRIKELEEARGKLKAIEDIAREILNRPNIENTRVILKRALTDILDISKSGEEVNENEN